MAQATQQPKNSQAYELYQLALKGVNQKEAIAKTGIKPRNAQWYWCVYGMQELVEAAQAKKAAKNAN